MKCLVIMEVLSPRVPSLTLTTDGYLQNPKQQLTLREEGGHYMGKLGVRALPHSCREGWCGGAGGGGKVSQLCAMAMIL